MASDVFPSTLRTWIDREFDRGPLGRLNVNAHLMGTYAWPLKVYYLGTNLRWLGEPDDVIAGFFASRLAREEFVARWQQSDLRLRRWLINSFCYYLMELRRQRKNASVAPIDEEDPLTFSGDPRASVDRAAVVAFVRRALDLTGGECTRSGQEQHFKLFLRHHVDGLSYRDLADEFGVDPARAAVMARTAARKFRAAIRDVLLRDGVPAGQIDQEIRSLLEET